MGTCRAAVGRLLRRPRRPQRPPAPLTCRQTPAPPGRAHLSHVSRSRGRPMARTGLQLTRPTQLVEPDPPTPISARSADFRLKVSLVRHLQVLPRSPKCRHNFGSARSALSSHTIAAPRTALWQSPTPCLLPQVPHLDGGLRTDFGARTVSPSPTRRQPPIRAPPPRSRDTALQRPLQNLFTSVSDVSFVGQPPVSIRTLPRDITNNRRAARFARRKEISRLPAIQIEPSSSIKILPRIAFYGLIDITVAHNERLSLW